MLLPILYSAFRLLLDALVDRQRPDADLRLELLVLRHQLRVLERQVKRPRWRSADRLTLAGLSRRLPHPIWLSFLVSPQTLLRWHRDLVRRRWGHVRPPSQAWTARSGRRAPETHPAPSPREGGFKLQLLQ